MTRCTTNNHDHCIDAALRLASDMCASKGLRLTTSRKRVLELVWAGHEAVKAYDIIAKFHDDGAPAKPPTVYRALEFLVENGLIHRIECLNAFVGCPHPEHAHDSHFFICEACHSVREMDASRYQSAIEAEAEASGFCINAKSLEVRGICQNCQ